MNRKKVIFICTVLLSVALIAFLLYFLTIFRLEASLQSLIKSQSNGNLIFRVQKVKLDIFHLRFDFKQPELRTVDSSNTVTGYRIKAEKFSLSVFSLGSVLAGKQLVVDSVLVQSPLIEVIKYKEGPIRKISLPDEMSKVYESLEKILEVMKLNYLHVDNAKFRITDRSQPDAKPLTVSHLNLTINNVSNGGDSPESNFLFADRILLEIYNEDIVFPDGYHGIRFKRFWMGTKSQTIKLDSCYIYARPKDSAAGEFSIFIDSLRIKKLDFNLLAKENTIKFDSALCINPDIRFRLQLKANRKKAGFPEKGIVDRDSVDLKVKKLLGDLDIGFLTVRNASVNVTTEKDSKLNVFKSQKSTFSIGGLLVNSIDSIPIQVKKVELDVNNYTGYSPDSLYVVMFDKVTVRDQKIGLSNFRINPSASNRDPYRKVIKMETFELDEIDWLALLYESRIVAGQASFIRPEVSMVIPQGEEKAASKEKINPFEILGRIQAQIQIGELYIEDGTMKFDVQKGPKFSMDHCYARINMGKLLSSEDEFSLQEAIDTLSFSRGDFDNSGTHFSLAAGSYSKVERSLFFKQVAEETSDKSQSVTVKNVVLEGIGMNSFSQISMTGLSWGKATVSLRLDQDKGTRPKSARPTPGYKLLIEKLNGGPTEVHIKINIIEASTLLNHISAGEIILENGQKPQIKGLVVDGQSINLDQRDKMNGSTGTFRMAENKPSLLSNVHVKMPVNGELADVLIPELTLSMDFNRSLNGDIKVDYIELHNPVISFVQKDSTLIRTVPALTKSGGLPVVHIKRISVYQPVLVNLPASFSEKTMINPGKSKFDILGITSDGETIQADSIHFSVLQPHFQTDKFQLSPTGKEIIDIRGSDLYLRLANKQAESKWTVNLTAIKMSGLKINTLHGDSVNQTIALDKLHLENLRINDSTFRNPEEFTRTNKLFSISGGNVHMDNCKTRLGIYNISFTKASNSLALDSIAFRPAPDREAFMKEQEFQNTYIEVHAGKINVKDIDFALLLKDTVFSAKKVTVSDAHLLAYKDRRLPFRHGIEKPMLTDLLLNISPKIMADSVILKHGLIEYDEFSDRTQQVGHIKLSNIKGAIAGARTFDPLPDDSLVFNVYARLIDTADLRVGYKQSYTDSLSGFNLKLIVSSFNLTALNPILRPFASAELKSGILDTIRMSVIGRKYMAYGTMKMYYDELNAQFLAKGDSSAKNVVTKSVSFFANRIVHSRKKRGSGDVFAERDPEKGFVNYWVKIVIGGVLTNSGVRTDKKQERKYKRSLNNYDLPPIPDIPVDY